ncbi:MAG: cell division FtsZ family protein [Clostridia bacterium]|nr:cell division FtsZ family protein [Clostridia bacterium]
MQKFPEIKVFGVGGSGCKVADMLRYKQYNSVEFYLVGSDNELYQSTCNNKIVLGSMPTAEEKDLLKAAVKGADLVVLTAGMGGRFGSEVTHLIAEIAKDICVPTVAAVCVPFSFEDGTRLKNSKKGLKVLREKADMTIAVQCDKIQEVVPESMSMSGALRYVDAVLFEALNSIISPVVKSSLINLDFEDLLFAIRGAGSVYFGVGIGGGSEKAVDAVNHAAHNTLSETAFENADKLIVRVEGADLNLKEMEAAANAVMELVAPTATVMFSADINESLKNEVRVSILASKKA